MIFNSVDDDAFWKHIGQYSIVGTWQLLAHVGASLYHHCRFPEFAKSLTMTYGLSYGCYPVPKGIGCGIFDEIFVLP